MEKSDKSSRTVDKRRAEVVQLRAKVLQESTYGVEQPCVPFVCSDALDWLDSEVERLPGGQLGVPDIIFLYRAIAGWECSLAVKDLLVQKIVEIGGTEPLMALMRDKGWNSRELKEYIGITDLHQVDIGDKTLFRVVIEGRILWLKESRQELERKSGSLGGLWTGKK